MKKLHLLLLGLTICLISACHDNLWNAIDKLDDRVYALEEICKEMNTNITALETIVAVLQSNDMITGIVEIKKDGKVIGYTITFSKHDSITIYHGESGQNGTDGKDGITPVIGVAQDTDGVYYWTLNGEWLLDDNGNKLPVSGEDGKDGANGADGKDGQDGADGKDGITPLLKIENGYWYISYDNGVTWTESGKATGNNGQNGQNGTDGKDGQDGANGQDGVTPLLKIENGYWYISYDNGATWAQLGKATGEDGKDGADGTNGTDGKDGQDGADGSNGQDGITPQLKIENGYWYVSYDNGTTWTQFGKATGADGQDGQNGTDGKDGQDGKDGKDGVTPQLKIEEGYWFISYDNGATWTQLGKATGEDGKDGTDGADGKDGQNGTNGKDGQDGDSMFQSVTQDENYVYFTLADGTVIKIAKGTSTEEEQPNSEFMFIVTYDANGGEGTMQPDTFYYGVAKKITPRKFTRASYCFVNWNTKVDGSGISYSNEQELMISKNITLYANWKAVDCKNYEYVDLGLSVLWSTCNIGASKPEGYGSYFAWGETYTKSNYTTPTYAYYINGGGVTKYCTNSSYGMIDNKTILDATDDVARVKWGGNWRIPTSAEISELRAKCSWTWTTNGYKVTSKINGNSIFLPAAGYKSGTSSTNVCYGYYWANSLYTLGSDYNAIVLWFYSSKVESNGLERWCGGSVRPVCR
jgi:hypothetical protein